MTPTIAALALGTLGAGLAFGAYSRRRAEKAQQRDPNKKLTNAIEDGKMLTPQGA